MYGVEKQGRAGPSVSRVLGLLAGVHPRGLLVRHPGGMGSLCSRNRHLPVGITQCPEASAEKGLLLCVGTQLACAVRLAVPGGHRAGPAEGRGEGLYTPPGHTVARPCPPLLSGPAVGIAEGGLL